MTPTRIAGSALALLLAAGTGAAVAQNFTPRLETAMYAPASGYVQDRDDHRGDHREWEGDWDSPPRGYSDIQLRGFRDGQDGARKDFGNHRRPNPNNRDNYRHPHDVPHDLDRDYRAAFRAGYERAFQHLEGRDRR